MIVLLHSVWPFKKAMYTKMMPLLLLLHEQINVNLQTKDGGTMIYMGLSKRRRFSYNFSFENMCIKRFGGVASNFKDMA